MKKLNEPEPTDAEFEAMLDRVVAAGKKVGCPTGMHTMDPQSALKRAAQGMQFIAVGSDLRFMTLKAAETIKAINPEGTQKELAKY